VISWELLGVVEMVDIAVLAEVKVQSLSVVKISGRLETVF
jgi:hypothetical protein